MTSFVFKTIMKRQVLPGFVIVIFCFVLLSLVVNNIISVRHSEVEREHHTKELNLKANVLQLSIERSGYGIKYDKELFSIINKLHQNIANKSNKAFKSKLHDAGIAVSQDGGHLAERKSSNIEKNRSSQHKNVASNPHPAKFPWKELTDEEKSITTRTQDLQIERQKLIRNVCDKHRELHNLSSYERMDYVLTDKRNKLIYGMVPKVASTTWTQLMIIHSGQFFDQGTSFHNINYRRDHIAKYGLVYMNLLAPDEQQSAIKNYYSWVFSRNPFERLVSAYRNKLNPGLPWYQERYGREIASMLRDGKARRSRGDDVTFPEFIQYLGQTGKFKGFFDEHWRPIYQLAYPCIVKYDFVGKLETLHEDTKYVLKRAYGLDSVDDSPFARISRTTNETLVAEYFKDIPERDIDKLRLIYALDIELFGYSYKVPKFKSHAGSTYLKRKLENE